MLQGLADTNHIGDIVSSWTGTQPCEECLKVRPTLITFGTLSQVGRGSLGASRQYVGSLGASRQYMGSLGASRQHVGSLGASRQYVGSLGASRHCVGASLDQHGCDGLLPAVVLAPVRINMPVLECCPPSVLAPVCIRMVVMECCTPLCWRPAGPTWLSWNVARHGVGVGLDRNGCDGMWPAIVLAPVWIKLEVMECCPPLCWRQSGSTWL